jgi:signal transduction histidine kinase
VEKIRSSNPKFSYVINAPRPVTACVDSRLFTQVISNLIENAVKYASEGGRVEIEITLVGTDDFRVSVRDFGKGMPQSQLRKIFDPFDRVTRSEYSTGLGLGLFICKRILEFHGGSIRVDSPPDGGTRFTITAPLRDTHSETRAAA